MSGRETDISGLALDVFDVAPVFVIATRGPRHELVYANEPFEEIVGRRPRGVPISEALPNLAERHYFELLDQVWRTGEPVRLDEIPITEHLDDGSRRRFYHTVSISPFSFSDGARGVLLVATDVTEQVTAAHRIHSLAEERLRLLKRYQSLLQASAQYVWVASPRGELIDLSAGWQDYVGKSWEEFRGFGWLESVHPDDRPGLSEAWAEAVEGGISVFEYNYRLRRFDGAYRHFEVRAVPVRENGTIVEWVGSLLDVEQRWRRQRSDQLLARAATATADATGLEEMIGALANVIVPELADGCGIYLLPGPADRPADEPTFADRLASAARLEQPRKPPLRREYFPPSSDFARAIRQRAAVYKTFPPGEPPPETVAPGSEEWAAATRANSMALLPIVIEGEVAAMVHVLGTEERPPISSDDIALIERILEHVRAPLSKIIELQRAQRVALSMQRSLLCDPPEVAGLRIVARYQPSRTAAEVGGDWYDAFMLPDGAVALVIGDVCGHDLEAAVTMGQYRNMLRALAVDHHSLPGDVLRRLDMAAEALYGDTVVTGVLARLAREEDGRWWVSYSVAGHPPPLLLHPDGDCRFLEEAKAPLLGADAEILRDSAGEPLPPRSTLLLYTDGLIERPMEDLGVGLERLRRQAGKIASESVDTICNELLARLAASERDDIALLAVRAEE